MKNLALTMEAESQQRLEDFSLIFKEKLLSVEKLRFAVAEKDLRAEERQVQLDEQEKKYQVVLEELQNARQTISRKDSEIEVLKRKIKRLESETSLQQTRDIFKSPARTPVEDVVVSQGPGPRPSSPKKKLFEKPQVSSPSKRPKSKIEVFSNIFQEKSVGIQRKRISFLTRRKQQNRKRPVATFLKQSSITKDPPFVTGKQLPKVFLPPNLVIKQSFVKIGDEKLPTDPIPEPFPKPLPEPSSDPLPDSEPDPLPPCPLSKTVNEPKRPTNNAPRGKLQTSKELSTELFGDTSTEDEEPPSVKEASQCANITPLEEQLSMESPILNTNPPSKATNSTPIETATVKAWQPTYLEDMLSQSKDRQRKELATFRKRVELYRNDDERDKLVTNVKVHLGRLWATINEETMKNIVYHLQRFSYNELYQKCLFDNLGLILKEEKSSDTQPNSITNSHTLKQMKIITLLDMLAKDNPSIIPDFAKYLKYCIFGYRRMQNLASFEACNLVRTYLTLLRMTGDENGVKLFLFDIFCHKFARNHIFVCILLDVWPEILRWYGYRTRAQEEQRFLDPLVDTIVWISFNSTPASSLHDLKVFEAANRLKDQCNVTNPKIEAVDFLKKLLNRVKDHPNNEKLKEDTTKCLYLICKWKEHRWAHNHVVSALFKLLESNGTSQNLFWVYDTLGYISRVYPPNERGQLELFFEPIRKTLMKDVTDSKSQDVSLRALIRLGHNFQVQVAQFLDTWRPLFPVSEETKTLLENFLLTRGKEYAEKTVVLSRKRRIRSMGTAKKPRK